MNYILNNTTRKWYTCATILCVIIIVYFYICVLLQEKEILYSLYGVVQHSGSLQGGHYIAYVRYDSDSKSVKNTEGVEEVMGRSYDDVERGYASNEAKDTWCYTSDSHVENAGIEEVHGCQAYLLLYVKNNS